ncbi:MAG: carbon-nitrogen hydrolase family protein [Caldilineales bacterium]
MNASASTISICTIQPATVWQEPERTFERIERQLAQACQTDTPDLVLLPEHFNSAVDEDGASRQWERARRFAVDLARGYRVNLVAGSVERWDERAGARVNTAIVLDRDGCELGSYQKRQLFGYEIERQVLPGQKPLVVEVEGVRCGVLICADLWFPELVREIAGEIDLLCVPAQTTIRPESDPAYARMLWHTMAMTRAQENVIAVAVSDHAATAEAPFRCGGVASITDPSAQPDLPAIQRVIDDGGAGYAVVAVDLERLARFRSYRRKSGLLPQWITTGDNGESAPRSEPAAPADQKAPA